MKLVPVCLLLAGCCSAPVEVPVRYPVEVRISCQEEVPAEPRWPVDELLASATGAEKVRALIAERYARMAYAAELKSALNRCRGQD